MADDDVCGRIVMVMFVMVMSEVAISVVKDFVVMLVVFNIDSMLSTHEHYHEKHYHNHYHNHQH